MLAPAESSAAARMEAVTEKRRTAEAHRTERLLNVSFIIPRKSSTPSPWDRVYVHRTAKAPPFYWFAAPKSILRDSRIAAECELWPFSKGVLLRLRSVGAERIPSAIE